MIPLGQKDHLFPMLRMSTRYIEKSMFNGQKHYPVYCYGAAYLFSPATASKIWEAFKKEEADPFWIEDVYLTGIRDWHVRHF